MCRGPRDQDAPPSFVRSFLVLLLLARRSPLPSSFRSSSSVFLSCSCRFGAGVPPPRSCRFRCRCRFAFLPSTPATPSPFLGWPRTSVRNSGRAAVGCVASCAAAAEICFDDGSSEHAASCALRPSTSRSSLPLKLIWTMHMCFAVAFATTTGAPVQVDGFVASFL